MIKLLEGIKNTNEIYLHYEPILKEKLKRGISSGELICTYGFRNIGKTYQLIELAKQSNWIVVEPNNAIAKYIRDAYCYDRVWGQDNIDLRKQQVVLVDEGVDIDKLLEKMECKIITGYTNTKNDEEDLDNKIIKSLKNDIESLLGKLEGTLRNDNFSNYKMLINNLKDTVDLKNELEKGNNPKVNQVYNIKCDLPNVNSIEEITRGLKDLVKQSNMNN